MKNKEFKLLSPGNSGNKAANRHLAMQFFLNWIENSKKIDAKTIETSDYGTCHVSAYTDAKGAMVSSGPGKPDQVFNPENCVPHSRDHWLMFREVGDGRVFVFICKPKDLFERRTIGANGVTWSDVMSCAVTKTALKIDDVLKILPENFADPIPQQ